MVRVQVLISRTSAMISVGESPKGRAVVARQSPAHLGWVSPANLVSGCEWRAEWCHRRWGGDGDGGGVLGGKGGGGGMAQAEANRRRAGDEFHNGPLCTRFRRGHGCRVCFRLLSGCQSRLAGRMALCSVPSGQVLIVQLFVASTPRQLSDACRAHCFAILVATHNLPVGSSGATHQHDEVDGENTCIDHLTVRDARRTAECYRTRVLRGWGWGDGGVARPLLCAVDTGGLIISPRRKMPALKSETV